MAIDVHQMQQWLAGAELRIVRECTPLANIPLLGRLDKAQNFKRESVYTEKIDLTRATNFKVQEGAEDLLVASLKLPILGERGVGNNVGIALATFNYRDAEGVRHDVIGICAYSMSGVLNRQRELRHAMVVTVK